MKTKKLFLLGALVLASVSWVSEGFALQQATHQYLNQKIAQMTINQGTTNQFSLDSYLKNNLGFPNGIQERLSGYSEILKGQTKQRVFMWVGEGGVNEDEPDSFAGDLRTAAGIGRSNNHFHNPLGGLWEGSGLNDYVRVPSPFWPYSTNLHYTGQSSILWAQNPNQDPDKNRGGNWSWYDARGYFYSALTGKDFDGKVVVHTYADMQKYYANTFRALGQLMHLVQDASVPAHVRNQIHLGFQYETWLEAVRTDKKEKGTFDNFIANPTSFDPSILTSAPFRSSVSIPIANIVDTGKYTRYSNPDMTTSTAVGIAEYTNANFFSERTVFSNAFPYPARTSVEPTLYLMMDPRGSGVSVTRDYYVKVRDGEKGYALATVGFLKYYITKYFPDSLLILNPKEALDGLVYSDYASRLLPRAVGYSAGLLQYFFRGNIEITLPDSGVYAQTAKPDDGFTQVKLKARNTTPNGEEMTDGTIELVVKYKEALENPFQSKEVATSPEFSYIIVPGSSVQPIPKDQPIIPRNQPREFVFDLTQTPIPLYATDLYLQVVYKGKLGLEDMAVAVGFKDISEPTPIDIFNDMDRICINGEWCEAGSVKALQKGQTYGIDAYPHNLIDSYIRLSSLDNPQVVSPTNYNFYIQQIAPGTYSRVFILGDYAGSNISYTGSGQKIDNSDTWPHFLYVLCPPGYTTRSPCLDVYKLIKNQTDVTNGVANRVYPTFNLFRGVTTWGGGAVENWTYPANSVCPQE
jgi:hypothetical protein